MWQRAELLIELEMLDEARSQMRTLHSLWSEQPQNLIELSKLQSRANDSIGAEKSLKTAIKLATNSGLPWLEYVAFLLSIPDLERARYNLTEMEAKFSLTPNVLMLKGDYASVTKDDAKAFNYYLKAHQADAEFTLPLIKMYEIAKTGEKQSTFLNYIRQHSLSRPDDNFAKHLLADTLYIQNQFEESRRLYRQLLEVENLPRKFAIYNNLANIVSNEDVAEALLLAEQAEALNGNSSAVLDTKGWLMTLNGKLEDGLDTLRKAYVLDSEDPGIHYHLAYTLHKLGRNDEALKIISKDNDVIFAKKAKMDELKNSLIQMNASNP
jgi:Flp pilus assembly protein TadD